MNKIPLEIIILNKTYAKDVLDLFLRTKKEYSKYFIPFEFNLNIIESFFGNAKKDLFFGLFVDKKMIGFYMLRGFDEGFKVPSYGVFIDENYSGKGLGQLTLFHAISQCKILNVKKLLLKVHPDNLSAKHIYEKNGFIIEGVDPKNDNLIMFKDL